MSNSHTNHVASQMPVNELYLSAPGKAILFGEHSVVYGKTAVAGSIDLRTYLSLYTSNDGRIYLSLPDIGVEKTWMLKEFLQIADELEETDLNDESAPSLELLVPLARRISGVLQSDDATGGVQNLAILAFLFILLGVTQKRRNLLAVKITVRFRLPSCVGLGSSGAYCVCIAAGLLCSAGVIPRPNAQATSSGDCLTWSDNYLEVIRKWAVSAESLIHGRASGLDAAVCTYGGISSYKMGTPIQRLANCPDLKVILVNSKVERSTIRMVNTVKEKLKKYPAVIESIFQAMDAISLDGVKILEKTANPGSVTDSANSSSTEDERKSVLSNEAAALSDDFSKLNDLSRINNHLLIALGVGHPKIDQICTTLARYGIHPKMTGAGGGGSVFAFLKPDTSQTILEMINREIVSQGFEMWQPSLGGDGIVLHTQKFDINTIANKS